MSRAIWDLLGYLSHLHGVSKNDTEPIRDSYFSSLATGDGDA